MQFDDYHDVVIILIAILNAAVLQADWRACPERNRRDLPLNRPNAQAKL